MDQRIILISLLVKLGVAAAVASGLARSRIFKSLLFKDERTLKEKIAFVIFVAVPLGLGVWVRLNVKNFLAADIAFESTLLVGVMAGRFAGSLYGALVSIPAMLAGGELATLPFNLAAGMLAGMLRDLARNKEDVWSFSPFIDLSIYRWIKQTLVLFRFDWHGWFFILIVALHFLRAQLAATFPGSIFVIEYPRWYMVLAGYATSVAVVALPIKIWNISRIERKLEEQERLLLQARMEALQSQINPHFLFNTLNSVSSLVRFDPDTARDMIVKLAKILRRLMRQGESFVQLREELEFIDDYLDIEVVRFGKEKLRVIKDLAPESLDLLVPSMLLQPLVENSIKHGLSPKIEGGSITIRSFVADDRLIMEVNDDGVGIDGSAGTSRDGGGIGLTNIAERLRVLYGDDARMSTGTLNGLGTRIKLEMPIMHVDGPYPRTIAEAIYEVRSSTDR